MYNTRSVTVTVRLPDDVADQVGELQHADPELLSRIVLYGMTRREIYRRLQERDPDAPPMPALFPGRDDLDEHQLRILAKNPGAGI